MIASLPTGRRGARTAAGVVAAAMAAILTCTQRLLHPRSMIDLEVYRKGAWAVLHARDPYSGSLPGPHLPYTYTPFSTLVWVPLQLLSLDLAVVVHTAVSSLALFLVVLVIAIPLLPVDLPRSGRLAAASAIAIAAYFSEPVLQTLGFGQVNLVLMALVVLDLVAWRQARWSGVLTGIAVGIKLTPLVFVAYLFAVGRRRTAVVASASAAATVLVGLVVLPTPTRQYFLDLMWNPRRVGNVGYVGDQSLNGMWARLLPGRPVAHLLWLASAAVVFGLGIWTARGVHHRLGEPAGIAVAAVTGLLVSPISWSHHWVWWLLPALVLCRTAWDRRSWGVLALCVAWTAPFYAGPFWFVPHLHHTDVPHGVGPQIVASTYVLVALVALVATATWISRPSPTSAPEPAARVPLGRAAPSHAV